MILYCREVYQLSNIRLLVIQTGHNAIHPVNYYPVDSIVCLANNYLYSLENDFFSGWFYPPVEQLGRLGHYLKLVLVHLALIQALF